MSTKLDDLVMAAKEGVKFIQMKRTEMGSTAGDQKCKSSTGRWHSNADDPGSSNVDSDDSEVVKLLSATLASK